MTTRNCSNGSFVPPAVEDVVGLARLELALVRAAVCIGRVDPAEAQAHDEAVPIVATNHRATTGQRCRALHIAIRTVAGSRLPCGRVDSWTSRGSPGSCAGARRMLRQMLAAVTRSGRGPRRRRLGLARERRATGALCLQSASLAGRDRFEWLDRQRRPSGSVVTRQLPAKMPSTRIVPIWRRSPAAAGWTPPGRDDPRAVGVAEQDVVVLGQEAQRRRGVGVGSRRVRAGRRARARARRGTSEPRPQPLHDLAQPSQARPRLDVHDRGRPERRRDSGRPARPSTDARLQRPAEPGLHRRSRHRPAAAPQPAWRDLDERHRGSRLRTSGASVGISGQRSASRRASSGLVRGRTSTSSRPAARTSLRSVPATARPNGLAR